jgi:hypothetical protein
MRKNIKMGRYTEGVKRRILFDTGRFQYPQYLNIPNIVSTIL